VFIFTDCSFDHHIMTISFANPEPLGTLTDQLSEHEQSILQQGEPVVTVSGSQFIGQIIATASLDQVWTVLTDYENFSDFLPTVVSSRVLESEGDRHIVEQIDSRKVLLAEVQSRVCTENIETTHQRIEFHLVEGDLDQMDGYWQMSPIANRSESESSPSQLLITQAVTAEAGTGPFEGIFHAIFEESLKGNLRAIRERAEQGS
jgi:ribosome-associated toxin RatA of RatAB toxin-antitoxin module